MPPSENSFSKDYLSSKLPLFRLRGLLKDISPHQMDSHRSPSRSLLYVQRSATLVLSHVIHLFTLKIRTGTKPSKTGQGETTCRILKASSTGCVPSGCPVGEVCTQWSGWDHRQCLEESSGPLCCRGR